MLRFHSGGLDRPSGYIVIQQFLTALNAIVDGQPVRLPQNPGKDAILPTMEDLVPKGKPSKGFFQKGFDTVGYALSANKYALLPFQPSYGEQKKEQFKSDVLNYTLGKAGMLCHEMRLESLSMVLCSCHGLAMIHFRKAMQCVQSSAF